MADEARKIVQVTCYGETGLVALCNDGTLWSKSPGTRNWFNLGTPPQPWQEKKEEKKHE